MTLLPTHEHILQIGMGFMASKTLLTATELELFTVLGPGPRSGEELGDRLSLHPRSLFDFLDALVALGLLERKGDGPGATYANTPETARFLDKAEPAYLGGILEMANARLYGFWDDLGEGLRTGLPQNEVKGGGDMFGELYADEARLEQFLAAMQGIQLGNFMMLLETVDFSEITTVCDVGGANGTFCSLAVNRHPHLRAISFDLPQVKQVAERHIAAMGASDRVEIRSGDFFADEFPKADVIVMGNILHDWDEAQKRLLIEKACRALNDGGRFIAIEAVIDDARRENAFGLLMSLNMLIELPGGFDYTGAQFDGWCLDAGFARTEVLPLTGPSSAAIAYV